jgi:hypothetical protein
VAALAHARQLLRGDVLRGKPINVLDVEADRGSGGDVGRFGLEKVQAPSPRDGVVGGGVCRQQKFELRAYGGVLV